MHTIIMAKMTKVLNGVADLIINSSRHVYELDALTTAQVMARKAYTHQEGTKCKLDMARTIT